MTAHSAAELITARRAIRDYREMAVSIDQTLAEVDLSNMDKTVKTLQEYARIARRAALAEEVDPEWRT